MKIFLRFDREEREFAAQSDASAREATDLPALIAKAQRQNHGYNSFAPENAFSRWSIPSAEGFNDLQEYLKLCANGKTEIRQIKVYHSNRYCMGIEVLYTNNNGGVSTTKHVSNHGYYSWHGGRMRTSELNFADDEYLCEVRTRQGHITDQITFCTNKRMVSFGGRGGSADPRSVCNTPVDLTKRVVAFVGTFHEVLGRLGTVSILHNWEIVREFVLLRALVERNRASPKSDVLVSKEEAMLQELMKKETNENVFYQILSFLIANVNVYTNNNA
jgi:hypothetical protein